MRINIPAGVDSGTRLRVSGEGNAGLRGGPSGDLYVFLKVKNHPKLRRDGLTIHTEINVSYLQAILGDSFQVDTVDGLETLERHCPHQRNSNCSVSIPCAVNERIKVLLATVPPILSDLFSGLTEVAVTAPTAPAVIDSCAGLEW